MGKLKDYSDSEWSTVSAVPQLVGVAMAGIAKSGIMGTAKEMFAKARSMVEAKENYSDNMLIQAIVPESSNAEQAEIEAKRQKDYVLNQLKDTKDKSSEERSEHVAKECSKAIKILEGKESPETVGIYKKWLLNIADNVANAAKEGDFLGIGGERFSEKERQLYEKLKTALK